MIAEEWPVVYKNDLLILDKTANIGIVTFWSKTDYVKNLLVSTNNINIIGNAYSKLLCLNPMLVNLSLNRYIRYLVLCGDDKEGAEHTLKLFFEGNMIESMDEQYMDALKIIKKQIKIINCTFDTINQVIQELPKLEPIDVPIIDIKDILIPKSAAIWNSHDAGYLLRSDDLLNLFFQINQKIMTRGKATKIRDSNIREINNLVSVYNGPLLDELDECFLVDKKRIKDYYNEFESRKCPDDQAYTYSSRINIDAVIKELQTDLNTKRAFSSIFLMSDYELKSNPCAVGVHYLISNNKLNCTVFFRSNDMYRAWPLNMLGFRYQQQLIANSLGMVIGPTTIVSSSAHIYSENWGNANDIIKRFVYLKNKYFDPEGYFICSKEEDTSILVSYFTTDGKIQWMWQKPSAEYDELIYEVTSYITDPQHAAYVSKEITLLANDIYTENSNNKTLKNTPSCDISGSCSIKK